VSPIIEPIVAHDAPANRAASIAETNSASAWGALLERCEDRAKDRTINVLRARTWDLAAFKPVSQLICLRHDFCSGSWSHTFHLGKYLGRAGIAWTMILASLEST
jgi:hypothetical protein